MTINKPEPPNWLKSRELIESNQSDASPPSTVTLPLAKVRMGLHDDFGFSCQFVRKQPLKIAHRLATPRNYFRKPHKKRVREPIGTSSPPAFRVRASRSLILRTPRHLALQSGSISQNGIHTAAKIRAWRLRCRVRVSEYFLVIYLLCDDDGARRTGKLTRIGSCI